MKTNRLFLAFALSLAVTFSSCSEEQSELTLDSISGSATITGTVKYNQGVKVSGSTIYENYLLPVANQVVYVDVDLSNYKSGSAGVERYTAVTDGDGKYSITIPVGQQSISDKLEVMPFEGSYGQIVNGVTYTYDNAIYQNNSSTSFTVSNGDQKVYNIILANTPELPEETLERYIIATGSASVVEEVVSYDPYTNYVSNISATYSYIDNLNNSEATICVSHATDNRAIYYTIDYSKGVFEEPIYFYDSWSFSDVTLTLSRDEVVVDEDASNSYKFRHYYVENLMSTYAYSQYLAGTYTAFTTQSKTLTDSYMNETVCAFSSQVVNFVPANITEINGLSLFNPFNW